MYILTEESENRNISGRSAQTDTIEEAGNVKKHMLQICAALLRYIMVMENIACVF